jgi:site-specific DNA recombinase
MKLSEIMPNHPNIVIAIDGDVTQNQDGNYLVNVGYLRVSTDRQAEEGFGLEIQREHIERYCNQTGLTNLALFVDDGYSGKDLNRPGIKKFLSMLEQYRNGKSKIGFSKFIIHRIDRLSRTLHKAVEFTNEYLIPSDDVKKKMKYTREDIDFICINENIVFEKNNPTSIFIFQMFATLAELDRNQIVSKLKRGREFRASKGLWNGSGSDNCPYGYIYNKDLNQGELIIDEPKADIVRKVFAEYIENHLAPAAIALKYGFKGERIVIQILERKLYAGFITYNGKEYLGKHLPIISLETWEKAQDEKKKRSIHRGDPHYMLTGLLYCGCCGSRLRYQKGRNANETRVLCYSRQPSKPHLVKDSNCDLPTFFAKDVEDAIIKQLFSYKIKFDTTKKKSNVDNILDNLKKQLVILENKYDYYSRLVMENEINPQKGESAKKRDRAQLDKINQDLFNLEAQIKEEESKQLVTKQVKKAEDTLANLESTWKYMSAEQKRNVCRELIERATIYKDNRIELKLKLEQFII